MYAFDASHKFAASALMILSQVAVADEWMRYDDSLSGKRVAIVVEADDAVLPVEATRNYFMDRGARVHLLTPSETPRQSLTVCKGSIDFVQMTDENLQPIRMGVLWRVNEVAGSTYDVIYVTSRAESGASAFLASAMRASKPVFLGGTMTRWADEADRVFAN